VIEAADLDEALESARKGSEACMWAGRGPALSPRAAPVSLAPHEFADMARARRIADLTIVRR